MGKRIKKRRHLEVALLQDELVDLLYSLEQGLVFHGGTAIWRCYAGNRFSEDLDFYGPVQKIDDAFSSAVKSRSLVLSKYKKTGNLAFSKISNGRVEVRLEVNFSSSKSPVVAPFERVDGSLIDVLTLSPEQLILEKIGAYSSRFFIRDLYDIYHLSNFVKDESLVSMQMRSFLSSAKQPVDEANLEAIVYSGAVPSFQQIVDSLKRRWL